MVFLCIIDGIIGSGKSSIMDILKGAGYKVEQQRVKDWSLLKPFYEDPKKYAYDLQVQIMESYNNIYNIYKDDYKPEFVFLESYALASYNSFGKMLEKDNILSQSEMHKLMKYINSFNPSLYIFLDVDVDVSMKRIAKRGRPGEENIKPEYQKHLKEAYMDFMRNLSCPIWKIDNNEDSMQSKVGENIIKYIGSKAKYAVAIHGNVASGKSSLGNHISRYGYNFVEEVITDDIIKLLGDKYEERNDAAYEIEKKFIEMHKQQMEKYEDKSFTCWEGCLSLLPVFAMEGNINGYISDDQYLELSRLYDEADLPKLEDFSCHIWLRPSTRELIRRKEERKRPGEESLTFGKLELFDTLYYAMLSNKKPIIIDNSKMSHRECTFAVLKAIRENIFK